MGILINILALIGLIHVIAWVVCGCIGIYLKAWHEWDQEKNK